MGRQPVAIVGSGLAALCAYTTLRHGGLEPAEIAVFGLADDPAAAWRVRASAIRQRRMRSESAGHCHPRSFPGLAVRSALRRRRPWPLLQTLGDRYHPTVEEFLDDVGALRARCGWDASLRRARIDRVRAVPNGFELDGHGRFAHVLVAPGHPGLAWPDGLRNDPRAVHAYEPHGYAGSVAVVGAGLAAATEWQNALAAGARVISVRRREPVRRPLNVPRELLSRRGLAAFHAAPPAARLDALGRLLAPSYPPDRRLDRMLDAAWREGRFAVADDVGDVDQVICATGFRRGFRHDPLLARLVEEEGLETAGHLIALAPDSCVPRLTDRTRTLSLAGVPAQWAFPAADTLMGAKYAARRFLRRVIACRTR
jgi:cation diffusion facilitator CzcD-associated flavoprotein CzcO